MLGIEKGARELPLGTEGDQGIKGERKKALSISPELSFRQRKSLKLLGEGHCDWQAESHCKKRAGRWEL